MKNVLATTVALVFSVSTLAQSGVSTMKSETTRSSKASGVTLGIIYSNITDAKVKFTSKSTYNGITSESSDTNSQKTHAGLYGLDVGYKNKYAWGPVGFSGSASFLKALNESELSKKITIYKIQGDVIYPITDMFSISGGLNVSYWDNAMQTSDGSTMDVSVEPGLGGQVGLQASTGSFGFLLGYQALGYTAKISESSTSYSYNSKAEVLITGMITQVSYTF